MPLCFPEKITSGPADMGVMGAEPECIGAKGVAKAGGTMPGGEGNRNYNSINMYFMTSIIKCDARDVLI